MFHSVITRILTLVMSNVVMSANVQENVQKERDAMFNKELEMLVGNDIKLSDSELIANKIIMNLKVKELEHGLRNPDKFLLSKHFFQYKDLVKTHKLFQIIKEMPKGAVLHGHDTGILSPDYLLKLTYWDNLYVSFHDNDIKFLFSKTLPTSTDPTNNCNEKWQLIRDARNASGNIEKFDAELRKRFTLVIDNPEIVYTDINAVWSIFQNFFGFSAPLVTYKPAWEQYFYDTLKAMREDGIMYFEVRSVLPSLYDLEGNTYDSVATAESYKQVVDRFVADFPDFFGAKLIYAPLRLVGKETIEEYIEIARQINIKIPGFLAGFDLVGQEDLGHPLKTFLPELIKAKSEFDLFLHAGETNWNGMTSDENLFDAIALGTKRIGHGYGIVKHPLLMQEIKKRDIALEVNVVSNAVLGLVADVRNHPLAVMLGQGLPVVLSCDDPGMWEADPLSHDFYVAFVAVASRHADLKLLKKLALNSLYYSTYSNKNEIIREFENRWTNFIDSVIKEDCSCDFVNCDHIL